VTTRTRFVDPVCRDLWLDIRKIDREIARCHRELRTPMVYETYLEGGGILREAIWPPSQCGPLGIRLLAEF
jgi:hypothetical protein